MIRRGMSLLEVMLALVILGACMATIGTLIRLGTHGAVEAREMTTAQLLCEAKVAEITSGILPADPGGPWEFDLPEHAGWEYYVDLQTLPQPGLISMTVTVAQKLELNETRKPLMFQLVRWIQDPGLELIDPFEEKAAAEAAAAPTTTTPATSTPGGNSNGM